MHEQSAAMAADCIWRVSRKVGVSMATSGPGATNLITGIACSYFDSIPSLHITGQVNLAESRSYLGAKVRQFGFQETNIVEMVRPITKYAVQVQSGAQLKKELAKAYAIALGGRMGPVLIDVPMNVQQEEMGVYREEPISMSNLVTDVDAVSAQINSFLGGAERPLLLWGAGIGLAGVERHMEAWLAKTSLPFVSSWNGLTYFSHDLPNYLGQIGVYGNRGANFVLQNCDRLLVLGSRLDNRQRSGNAKNFVPGAKVHVLDVDSEELKKYQNDKYGTSHVDLKDLPSILAGVGIPKLHPDWTDYVQTMKSRYFDKSSSTYAEKHGTISPYDAIRRINGIIQSDSIVVADTVATVCWVFQAFKRAQHCIFTAGGNSPMGYALPAAIAAKVQAPEKQVVCLIGDGGFQLNIQELQTVFHYGLDICIVVFNNHGYGIIKQFQDSYLGQRYEATGNGYSTPDFRAVVQAYGLNYQNIESIDQIVPNLFSQKTGTVIDISLDPNTWIEPKLEMGRPINDQFPYLDEQEFLAGNRFVQFARY
jgi:acetolactate synthase-1/2/3 large subunit